MAACGIRTRLTSPLWMLTSLRGANIGTGIGFKHFMYLSEEAVPQHLRACGVGPGHLYEQYGLCGSHRGAGPAVRIARG